MASNRLLSQITELHQVIAKLKAENRRLVSRSKASRAYARTVEQSTFFPYAGSTGSGIGSSGASSSGLIGSASIPVLSLSASVISDGGSFNAAVTAGRRRGDGAAQRHGCGNLLEERVEERKTINLKA